jgi:hypothetical protein
VSNAHAVQAFGEDAVGRACRQRDVALANDGCYAGRRSGVNAGIIADRVRGDVAHVGDRHRAAGRLDAEGLRARNEDAELPSVAVDGDTRCAVEIDAVHIGCRRDVGREIVHVEGGEGIGEIGRRCGCAAGNAGGLVALTSRRRRDIGACTRTGLGRPRPRDKKGAPATVPSRIARQLTLSAKPMMACGMAMSAALA